MGRVDPSRLPYHTYYYKDYLCHPRKQKLRALSLVVFLTIGVELNTLLSGDHLTRHSKREHAILFCI